MPPEKYGGCAVATPRHRRLANLTAPHQPLAPWRSRLTPVVEGRRAAHLKTSARLAGRLFAEKPKAFRRRIEALWSARRARKHAGGKA